MDSSHWLQEDMINHETSGMESMISSPASEDDMLACAASAARPLMDRRLRPPHDQALKCPRCDSAHTKFCYYNNYSLSQPRYFCKTCRRYWTKGGTLRNIPVGGGCRKNKKVAGKKSSSSNDDHQTMMMINQNSSLVVTGASSSSSMIPTDLHLSFPEVQLSHLYGSLGTSVGGNYLESKYPRPIDFLESKFDQAAVVDEYSRSSQNYMGNGIGDMSTTTATTSNSNYPHGLIFQPSNNFNGLMMGTSPFGLSSSLDVGNENAGGGAMHTCQRLMLPYDYHGFEEDNHHQHHDHDDGNAIDVKPINTNLLSVDWQDHHHQGCLNGVGSWTAMMKPYAPSTTNPLV